MRSMRCVRAFSFLTLLVCLALPAAAQETPKPMVASYGALADAILALRAAEEGFVRSVLDVHRGAAQAALAAGDAEAAAGHMALFANEGDNAMGGVRKRLVEGGHHHNAAGDTLGIYEAGYVVVNRDAKKALMAAATAMRTAADDTARQAAWREFDAVAGRLLGDR